MLYRCERSIFKCCPPHVQKSLYMSCLSHWTRCSSHCSYSSSFCCYGEFISLLFVWDKEKGRVVGFFPLLDGAVDRGLGVNILVHWPYLDRLPLARWPVGPYKHATDCKMNLARHLPPAGAFIQWQNRRASPEEMCQIKYSARMHPY